MSHSFTRLTQFLTCPSAYNHRYLLQTPPISPSTAWSVGTLTHNILEARAKKEDYQLDPAVPLADYKEACELADTVFFDFDKIWAVEKKLNFSLCGVPLKGSIDRIDYEHGVYTIVDYKTGRFLPARDEIESNLQMVIYTLGLQSIVGPDSRIIVKLQYLRHGVTYEYEFSEPELQEATDYITKLAASIEATKEFAETPNPFCGWCGYRHLCQTYHAILQDREDRDYPTREELMTAIRILEKRKEEVDAGIKARLEKDGEFEQDGMVYSIGTTKRKWIDAKDLGEHASELGRISTYNLPTHVQVKVYDKIKVDTSTRLVAKKKKS